MQKLGDLHLRVWSNGAAFDDPPDEEVAKTLETVADQIRGGKMSGDVCDSNGKPCCFWAFGSMIEKLLGKKG